MRNLKKQFKDEFLQDEELPLEEQKKVWRRYESLGLSPQDAKEVCQELTTVYKFKIEQP